MNPTYYTDSSDIFELLFRLFCSPEPAADHPECSSEAGRAAASQHPQRSHGRQQSDETAADREGKTATEATGAASAETTGQESVSAFQKLFKGFLGSTVV